jgi:hypothetical protein
MGILMSMAKSRAVKKMAKVLPGFLVPGYGHGGPFSQGQIDTAVAKTGCDVGYIDYAYAMFCDEATFKEISSEDYQAIHQEVAELCFKGNSDFTAADVASYSADHGVGDVGGGDGGGSD